MGCSVCHQHGFNQPLNSWNVSTVTSMELMFYCCPPEDGCVFNQPLVAWDVRGLQHEPNVLLQPSFQPAAGVLACIKWFEHGNHVHLCPSLQSTTEIVGCVERQQSRNENTRANLRRRFCCQLPVSVVTGWQIRNSGGRDHRRLNQ